MEDLGVNLNEVSQAAFFLQVGVLTLGKARKVTPGHTRSHSKTL